MQNKATTLFPREKEEYYYAQSIIIIITQIVFAELPEARGSGVVKLASSPPPKSLQFKQKQSSKGKHIQGQAETNTNTLAYSLKQNSTYYNSVRMGGGKMQYKNVLNQESRGFAAGWGYGFGHITLPTLSLKCFLGSLGKVNQIQTNMEVSKMEISKMEETEVRKSKFLLGHHFWLEKAEAKQNYGHREL